MATETTTSPWGSTIIWAAVPGKYTGKLMRIESGQRMSLQFHEYKDESVVVLHGTLFLELDGICYELEPGRSAHIPCGTVHRMSAAKENGFVIVAEVSTFDDGDIVRIQDDYGRA